MDTNATTQPIVVGFDSGGGDAAFDWAQAEAERRDLPLSLLVAEGVLYAAAPGFGATTPWPEGLTDGLHDEARRYVKARAGDREVDVRAMVGTPAAVLVAASDGAELVVVGRRQRSALGEFFAGSTSAQVVAHASCPVVVVDREFSGPPTAPIVVGVDGSVESRAALEFAFERASYHGAPGVGVHGWWLDAPGDLPTVWLSEDLHDEFEDVAAGTLDDALAPWVDRYPDVEVRKVLERQVAAEAVLSAATDAQLIVVGSRGRGGFAGLLLGSVSQSLLHSRQRACPIAVLHIRTSGS
jgi:nucleotide-binding universal stress UspA family protein